jgi:hypothetical protein
MEISVQHNIMDVLPELDRFTSRQAPFAIAKALTTTAKQVQGQLTSALPTAFNRPTAWTRRAFAITPARKDTLTSWVFAKDSQARYLKFGVQGGRRRVKGFEKRFDGMVKGEKPDGQALVPTRNVRLDAQGNVSLATIKRMSQTNSTGKVGRYFVGKPKGGGRNADLPVGVYARMGNNKRLEMQFAFMREPAYRKRLDMQGIGARTVRERFAANLRDSYAAAVRTAR